MGNEQSTSELSESRVGFRVLGIQENSPASPVGFVSFFDFIVAANEILLDVRDSTFMELIAHNEDKQMTLTVYNVKSQTTREVVLTPSRNWPGKGMLGVTIRFDSFEGAEDQVLRVLDVTKKSPADIASLQSNTDYLLGTPKAVFRDTEDLYDEIVDHLDQPLQCYVYNSVTDEVRIVVITTNDRWGGEGFLGAEIGHGYLHRLPQHSRNSTGKTVGYLSISSSATASTDIYAKPLTQESTIEAEPSTSQTRNDVEDKGLNSSQATTQDQQENHASAIDNTGIPPPAPVQSTNFNTNEGNTKQSLVHNATANSATNRMEEIKECLATNSVKSEAVNNTPSTVIIESNPSTNMVQNTNIHTTSTPPPPEEVAKSTVHTEKTSSHSTSTAIPASPFPPIGFQGFPMSMVETFADPPK